MQVRFDIIVFKQMCILFFIHFISAMKTLIRSDHPDKFKQDSLYESDVFSCLFSPRWKQKKIWVKVGKDPSVIALLTEEDKKWLVSYLSRSPIEAVCLYSDLGEMSLDVWANACRMARKPAFLRLSSKLIAQGKRLPSRKGLSHRLNQVMDGVVAIVILLVFSPLMMGLMLFIRTQNGQPTLNREWCVGKQGRLFQLLTFNLELPFELSRLPNLVSVLRCETNLRQTDHYDLHQLIRD